MILSARAQEVAVGAPRPSQPPCAVESLLWDQPTIAFARFGRDGQLVSANAGFAALCSEPDGPVNLGELVIDGQRAEITRLLAGADPSHGPRNVHLARGTDAPVSMEVTWTWEGDELLMLGQQPTADLAATQTQLVKLNARVSVLARESAKKSAELGRALEDLKSAEAMLVHGEKIAALGRMTAGVAHELNNPLAYARNSLYLTGQGVRALLDLVNLFGESLSVIEAEQPELFEVIMAEIEAMDLPRTSQQLPALVGSAESGVDRAIRLVESLRTFSRLDEAALKTIDLNESLRSVVEFVGYLLEEQDTRLRVDLGELPRITCSPGDLNQAVLNILTNAIQAASPGGRVDLSTALALDEVVISVSDDGPGVPAEMAEQIFEPFVTTRPVGTGTGLGLSIAQTVVAAHGGRITLDPCPGGGARFTIHLPLDRGGVG